MNANSTNDIDIGGDTSINISTEYAILTEENIKSLS